VERLKKDSIELANRVSTISSADELAKARIQSSCKGATLTQGAASLWPYKYVAWILKYLIKKGSLNLQTNTPVNHIESFASQTNPAPDQDAFPARYILHTSRGPIYARNILLATNAYTSHLLPQLSTLIVPVRETMTALIPPLAQEKLLPHSYGFQDLTGKPLDASGEYLVQQPFVTPKSGDQASRKGYLMLGGGRTIASTTMPSVGEADDSVIDPAVVAYLQAALPRALIFSGEGATAKDNSGTVPPILTAEASWTGIWAGSRDGSPWVGAMPGMPRGIWVSGGYTGHGMPNATLCGKALVKMIMEDEDSKSSEEVANQLVRLGELPASYVISEERMRRAMEMMDVHTQDRNGKLGIRIR
jgi:glycine/D-amino acid oxidase-like deaminating enzyme